MRLGVLCLLVACGGSDGEPIAGDITITYGDETITPSVGAAVSDVAPGNDDDPTKALVVIGTREISCETTLNSNLPKGTYVSFTIDRTVGTQTPFVSVIRVESGSAHLNGSTGEVIIDLIADRVTGSVTFDTEDDDAGIITAGGTFDVIRCF